MKMIERVAAAMQAQIDFDREFNPAPSAEMYARSAIEAMRYCTDFMTMSAKSTGAVGFDSYAQAKCEVVWKSMIDGALKE